jgi:hypothetical protein
MNELALLSSWESEPWFAELTDENRVGVRERAAAIERILKAPRRVRGAAERCEAARLGMKPSSMRRWVTLFRKMGGNPQSLIDHRIEPHLDAILPEPFLEFCRSLFEENQRSSKAAWRKLRELYRSHATSYQWQKTSEVIYLWPGYAVRPDPSPSSNDGMPRGWSYSNLTRPGNGLTKLEEVAARQGPGAAADLLEQVFTTRVGLKPGQYYVFDDRWVDVKSVMPPSVSKKPVRSVELSCGDIASGSSPAWGLLPMIDDDFGRQQRLKDRDMRMLLAKVICLVGFHRDGVTLMVEHGTAAISRELELKLCVMSGGEVRDGQIVRDGLIKVKRSGITGGKSFAGGFPTLGKGNFRFKAAWESMHNMKHNELADLPGQVGKNSRLETVETDHGMDAEARMILTAAAELRPEVAKGLVTGYLPFSELFWANARAIERIENYTDHKLQGWVEAGNVIAEFRHGEHSDDWQPMDKLLTYSVSHRAAMEVFFHENPWSTRTRQLSRREAWLRGRHELVKLPLHCVPEILGTELAVVKEVADDLTFTFCKAGEDDLIYRAIARRANGTRQQLVPGTAYRTWVNPYDTGILFVSTVLGGFIGTCDLRGRIERPDVDAFKRQAAEAGQVQAEVLAPFYARAVKRNRAITNQRRANAAAVERAAAGNAVIEDSDQPDFGSLIGK